MQNIQLFEGILVAQCCNTNTVSVIIGSICMFCSQFVTNCQSALVLFDEMSRTDIEDHTSGFAVLAYMYNITYTYQHTMQTMLLYSRIYRMHFFAPLCIHWIPFIFLK